MLTFNVHLFHKNKRLEGVPSAFWKKTTLRACKILYSFSANPVTNENLKTHARIGIYIYNE